MSEEKMTGENPAAIVTKTIDVTKLLTTVDEYKARVEFVKKQLVDLDQQYNEKRTELINMGNQLAGAIAALEDVLSEDDDKKKE